MQMEDGLAGSRAVVLQDVDSVAAGRFLNGGGNLLRYREDLRGDVLGKREQVVRMLLRENDDMSLMGGSDIENRAEIIVFIYGCGRDDAVRYLTKNTIIVHCRIPPKRKM